MDSPYSNAGTTNINACVLADIATKTTYPPIVYSNKVVSVNTNLSPQAPRDTDTPDLGYHYYPLDYAFGGTEVDSNVTFTAGTAVGWFRTASGYMAGEGIHLLDNAVVSFNGTATAPDYWVRSSTVQEGGTGYWEDGFYGNGGMTSWASDEDHFNTVNLQFTRCSTVADYYNYSFQSDGCCGMGHMFIHANDCEFSTTGIGGYFMSLYLTNCLFLRAPATVVNDHISCALTMVNCTQYGGADHIEHWSDPYPVHIENCAFDDTDLSDMDDPSGGNTNITYCDFNAFLTNANRLVILGVHDVTNLISFNWQSSWFGNYYQPTNSPLINKGSVTADQVGLYHFTTQTNQVPETNSIVDIGYHYVATDTNGIPLDSNGDGIPDYLEDANGNGLDDPGETPWNFPSTGLKL